MLNQLTWNHFFLAAGTSLLLYYLVVALLCFRQELKTILQKAKDRLFPPVYLVSTAQEHASPGILSQSPMAKAASHNASVLTAASDILIAPRAAEEGSGDNAVTENSVPAQPDFPMGTLADMLEEMKSLLELVSETQMDKEEFLSLLQLITSKYSRAAQSLHKDKVQRFLLEQAEDKLSFSLTHADLQALWPKA